MSYDATTGAMCFSAALTSLKKDGRVRRQGWSQLCWIGVDRTSKRFPTIYFRFPNGVKTRWLRPAYDLLADDWVEAIVPYGVTP